MSSASSKHVHKGISPNLMPVLQHLRMPATNDRWQDLAGNIEHMFCPDALASIKTAICARILHFHQFVTRRPQWCGLLQCSSWQPLLPSWCMAHAQCASSPVPRRLPSRAIP